MDMNKASKPDPARVADVLFKSAEKIVNPGWWVQGRLVQFDETRQPIAACAVGTIAAVAAEVASNEEEYRQLIPAARSEMAGVVGSGVETWNDAEGRTVEEVAEAMRRTGDKLIGRHYPDFELPRLDAAGGRFRLSEHVGPVTSTRPAGPHR